MPYSQAELAHWGIKGMKWGVRREQSTSVRVAKLQSQLKKVDSNKALAGIGLKGAQLAKIHKKRVKNDPNFDRKQLSEKQKLRDDKVATRKAINSILLRGTPQVAAIVGGGLMAVNHVGGRPETIRGARAGVGVLGLVGAKIMYSDIAAVREANKLEGLQRELRTLQPNKRGGYF